MSSINENIVREYFELHGFLVRQHQKHIPRTRREEDGADFLVINPQPALTTDIEPPFVLSSESLPLVSRAVIAVKGWHTEIFSHAVLSHASDIFRFTEARVFDRIAKQFGCGVPPKKILVVPALPQNEEARKQSIQALQSRGVDAVIPFRTMLADLISHIEINNNYQKSDLLQIIRILKNYEFFKEPQMELFKTRRKRR